MGFKFGNICRGSAELAALERLEKIPYTIVVSTLVCSFLDGAPSFLQVTMTTIKALVSLSFAQLSLGIVELSTHECLE